MSSEKQISVTICTTKVGWDHIIELIKRDNNSAWSNFNEAVIKIIEDNVDKTLNVSSKQQKNKPLITYDDYGNKHYDEYHIGDDGLYHDDDYFNEEYGSYSNFRRLFDEASDLGFPDADTYRQWLDE